MDSKLELGPLCLGRRSNPDDDRAHVGNHQRTHIASGYPFRPQSGLRSVAMHAALPSSLAAEAVREHRQLVPTFITRIPN